MYGTATELEMIGKKTSETGELLDYDVCDLDYKKTSPWLVFEAGKLSGGDDGPNRDGRPRSRSKHLRRLASRRYLHFAYNTIYVCKTDTAEST